MSSLPEDSSMVRELATRTCTASRNPYGRQGARLFDRPHRLTTKLLRMLEVSTNRRLGQINQALVVFADPPQNFVFTHM